MDRDGIRSEKHDNDDETILELPSTGNSSVVLPTSNNEVWEGSHKIKSASSKDAEVQSLLTPGERESDEQEGGQRKSMSFRLSGRQKSKSNKVKRVSGKGKTDAFGEKRNAMMVVSVLIATVTYQAALNPPGGFWQDDQNGSNDTSTTPPTANATSYESPAAREAGTAINREFNGFQAFLIANTVGLFASLVIILLLTSAITIKRQIMMWVLMFIMWVSVFSVAFSFCMGALIILRDITDPAVNYIVGFVLCCAVLFVSLVILHMVVGFRRVYRWLKKKPAPGEED